MREKERQRHPPLKNDRFGLGSVETEYQSPPRGCRRAGLLPPGREGGRGGRQRRFFLWGRGIHRFTHRRDIPYLPTSPTLATRENSRRPTARCCSTAGTTALLAPCTGRR